MKHALITLTILTPLIASAFTTQSDYDRQTYLQKEFIKTGGCWAEICPQVLWDREAEKYNGVYSPEYLELKGIDKETKEYLRSYCTYYPGDCL